MGLTINFNIKFTGKKDVLINHLKKVRSKCLDKPFQSIGEIKEVEVTPYIIDSFNYWQTIFQYPNNSSENLSIRDKEMEKLGVTTWQMIELMTSFKRPIKSSYIISLPILVGQGSEDCHLRFFKTKTGFRCHSFCKTQYALDFKKCHLLVIYLLDMFKADNFKITVRDDGKYWKTRDLNILAKELFDYRNLVRGIGDILTDTFGDNIQFAGDTVFDETLLEN